MGRAELRSPLRLSSGLRFRKCEIGRIQSGDPLRRPRALCWIVFCASLQTLIITGLAKRPPRAAIEPSGFDLFTSLSALANVIAEPRSRERAKWNHSVAAETFFSS